MSVKDDWLSVIFNQNLGCFATLLTDINGEEHFISKQNNVHVDEDYVVVYNNADDLLLLEMVNVNCIVSAETIR